MSLRMAFVSSVLTKPAAMSAAAGSLADELIEWMQVLLRLLTAAVGTRPTSQHVRDHGESWRVSGQTADRAIKA
jgi:hypothetical protein